MALAEIGRFNRFEAHILVGRLESEGIPAVAFDAEASIADGSAFLIPVRVMVDAEDVAEARAIIENLPDF
ncbi:putative signal transducing protein [Stakelama tenebrarum]|uniref:DUF2007 domain-containing protein n=1 Tax=Stakelama tenebrarum TaxID=2711215 RepID=A0A6G6Y1G1_9SPHN|nr:DUF2007 domain-containing protein [Sphingosinithalassobacter tenebrarum]QIG78647.1 DUF2007 domain-containing protein [Sphingosinithalassobacter tenebrarum]